MNLKKGLIINVQAYKHNGTLYKQWNGVKVIKCSPNELVLYMFKTKVKEKNQKTWSIKEPVIWKFWRNEFYNSTSLLRDNGPYYYVNLASPPVFENNTLKFIDYDLDIKKYPQTKIKIVDQKEFDKNKVNLNYPKNLIQKIIITTEIIFQKLKNKEGFFDKEKIKYFYKKVLEEKLLSKKYWKKTKFIQKIFKTFK